jgi:predicted secreted hydrolase
MLFQLRHVDGSIDPYSSGTYIDRAGRATHLTRNAFQLQPLDFWTSPKTGARYPLRWRISIPSLQLTLECAATVAGQELISEDAAIPTYWEGAVTYSGSVTGAGYLEMTGYVQPVHF